MSDDADPDADVDVGGACDDERRRQGDAYRKALGLLVRREQSRRGLKRKLAVRGVDAVDADAAVERLAGQGFQDDVRFAISFARDRAAAGYGPVRIRHELATHGLPTVDCDAALDACDGEWGERAARLVERRAAPGELDDPDRRRRMFDFLLRRGFDPGMAHAAIARRRGLMEGD